MDGPELLSWLTSQHHYLFKPRERDATRFERTCQLNVPSVGPTVPSTCRMFIPPFFFLFYLLFLINFFFNFLAQKYLDSCVRASMGPTVPSTCRRFIPPLCPVPFLSNKAAHDRPLAFRPWRRNEAPPPFPSFFFLFLLNFYFKKINLAQISRLPTLPDQLWWISIPFFLLFLILVFLLFLDFFFFHLDWIVVFFWWMDCG